jgi:hypothetical protein
MTPLPVNSIKFLAQFDHELTLLCKDTSRNVLMAIPNFTRFRGSMSLTEVRRLD